MGWAQSSWVAYDPISRLATLALDPAGTSDDASTTFTYSPAGQIASSTRTNDLYAWTGGVNVNRGYTANGLNQYTAAGPASFGYDTNGNLTSDGTNTFVYDVENRLVTRSGGAAATLRYDPLGRLYEVTGPSGTRRFLYDDSDLVAEYNTAGTVLRRYVHGLGAGDDPLAWLEGSGVSNAERRYLYADERGSIVAVTDSAGTVLNRNSYDEYGIPAAGNAGAFQYTGQVWLPELGMYHYKARMYSPTLGRFMQTDPIGYGDGMNMYAYVGNDPVNGMDPTGLLNIPSCVIETGTARTCPPHPPQDDDDEGPPIVVTGDRCAVVVACITDVAGYQRAMDPGVGGPASNGNGNLGGPGGPELPQTEQPAPAPRRPPPPPKPKPHPTNVRDMTTRQKACYYFWIAVQGLTANGHDPIPSSPVENADNICGTNIGGQNPNSE